MNDHRRRRVPRWLDVLVVVVLVVLIVVVVLAATTILSAPAAAAMTAGVSGSAPGVVSASTTPGASIARRDAATGSSTPAPGAGLSVAGADRGASPRRSP